MINLSLPIRPRTDVRAEYLTTPISVFNSVEGSKVLCLTSINSENEENTIEYQDTITNKLGNFDRIFSDKDPKVNEFIQDFFKEKRNLVHLRETEVLRCECGKYEEVADIRMYNQRRVKDDVCTYCNTEIKKVVIPALFMDLEWSELAKFFSFNDKKKWNKTDFEHFLGRQDYLGFKISKDSEPVKIEFDGMSFGIKHQLVWAFMLNYISQEMNDRDLRLHMVDRVSTLGFLTAFLAEKVAEKPLQINFEPLPVVWLPEEVSIKNVTKKEISSISFALGHSNKKEVKVDKGRWFGGEMKMR